MYFDDKSDKADGSHPKYTRGGLSDRNYNIEFFFYDFFG